ncbi:aspartate/glutamate racemase family protein [Pseudemcibacter aquimaris]|nr:aspartate/glutamate racemase family protein [Pseudemcibacter aquimaris]
MSWESTAHYYSGLNKGVKAELGGLHSAKIAMYSVDFAPVEAMQHKGDLQGLAAVMIDGAKRIEAAGADFMLICTNTMHEFVPDMEPEINIPILHIADATAEVIKESGIKKVGLLGTAFTMEKAFYKDRLIEKHGIDVITPGADERKAVHDIIYQELCLGEIKDASKAVYLRIIDRLAEKGAEAVILGCTEIGMLVKPQDTNVKLLDTTEIHAEKAVEMAIKE